MTKQQTFNLYPSDNDVAEIFQQFLKHLNDNSIREQDTEIDQINRRMDSLARLCEGGDTCAAVSVQENKVYVSTNKIHKNSSTTTANYILIDRILRYFSKVKTALHPSQRQELFEEKIEILLDIIPRMTLSNARWDKLNAELTRSKTKELIKDFYTSNQATKIWRDSCNTEDKVLLQYTSRLIRDFEKLEKSISQDQQNNDFISLLTRGKFTILRIDHEGVHAEMRHMVTNNYIGISKLGCAHCSLLVENSRGKHSQVFSWPIPDFLENDDNSMTKLLGQDAYDYYIKLNDGQKTLLLNYVSLQNYKENKEKISFSKLEQNGLVLPKLKNKNNKEMLADDSDSDIEISDPTQKQIAKKVVTKIENIKTDTSLKKELKGLNFSNKQINDLKKLDKKWELIKHYNIFKLIEQKIITQSNLSFISEYVLELIKQNDLLVYIFEERLLSVNDIIWATKKAERKISISNDSIYFIYKTKMHFRKIQEVYISDRNKFSNIILSRAVANLISENNLSYEIFERLYNADRSSFSKFADELQSLSNQVDEYLIEIFIDNSDLIGYVVYKQNGSELLEIIVDNSSYLRMDILSNLIKKMIDLGIYDSKVLSKYSQSRILQQILNWYNNDINSWHYHNDCRLLKNLLSWDAADFYQYHREQNRCGKQSGIKDLDFNKLVDIVSIEGLIENIENYTEWIRKNGIDSFLEIADDSLAYDDRIGRCKINDICLDNSLISSESSSSDDDSNNSSSTVSTLFLTSLNYKHFVAKHIDIIIEIQKKFGTDAANFIIYLSENGKEAKIIKIYSEGGIEAIADAIITQELTIENDYMLYPEVHDVFTQDKCFLESKEFRLFEKLLENRSVSEQILFAMDKLGIAKVLEIFFGDKFKASESELVQLTAQKACSTYTQDKKRPEIISGLAVPSTDIENKYLNHVNNYNSSLQQHSSLDTASRIDKSQSVNNFIQLGNYAEIARWTRDEKQHVTEQLLNIPFTIGTGNNNHMSSSMQPNDLSVKAELNVQIAPEQFLSSVTNDSSEALIWQQRIRQEDIQNDIGRSLT